MDPHDQKQPLLELEELRVRLEEAEGTLFAIRNGEVDALVVEGKTGEQIFTLNGADHLYRKLIEDMREGAIILSEMNVILFANGSFAEFIKSPLEKIIGSFIHQWFAHECQMSLEGLLKKDEPNKSHCELILVASDGGRVPIYLSLSKVYIAGNSFNLCLVATDLTEINARKQKETELLSEQLIEANKFHDKIYKLNVDLEEKIVSLNQSNRYFATISAVNRQLVYASKEVDLLQAICQIIVEQSDNKLAWVGYLQQDDNNSLKIIAHSNYSEGHIGQYTHTGAESEVCMEEPIMLAIRSGKSEVCNNIANDVLSLTCRELAKQLHLSSLAAFPLVDRESKIFGVLAVYSDKVNAFTAAEIELLTQVAGDLSFGVCTLHVHYERNQVLKQNQKYVLELQTSLENTVEAFSGIVDMRDPYTAGHQNRVAKLAVAIAEEMRLDSEQVQSLHYAAIIHDIGKIKIPAEILSKPGPLTEIEFLLIKTHAQASYDILKGINFPWPIAKIVLQHHERFDGSGYPNGLKGEEIMLEARILSIADVLEAMSSHRPYRPGLGIDAALAEIKRGSGSVYDSVIVESSIRLFRDKGYVMSV